jgi:ribosome-binding ATPase YchF (GTP1/OBG family)
MRRRKRRAQKTPASCAQEGKDYIVQDGDVMLFKFNV